MASQHSKPPIIGVVCNLLQTESCDRYDAFAGCERRYTDYIRNAGGICVMLCPHDIDNLDQLMPSLDGILFSGGEDVDPKYYNEPPDPNLGRVCAERDTFELALMESAHKVNLPILAICRGCQVLNIYRKGSLYQHMENHKLTRKRTGVEGKHEIIVKPDTLLSSIWPDHDRVSISSSHHQAVKDVGENLVVNATAPDGTIEGIEDIDQSRFILGIQGHPEVFTDERERELAKAFIARAQKR